MHVLSENCWLCEIAALNAQKKFREVFFMVAKQTYNSCAAFTFSMRGIKGMRMAFASKQRSRREGLKAQLLFVFN